MPYIKTVRTILREYYVQKISIHINNFQNKQLFSLQFSKFTVTLFNFVETGTVCVYHACQSSKFAIKNKTSDKNTNQ